MSHNSQIIDPADSPFPVDGLLPKNVTQASNFISTNPTYDGRGTVVAILDTGVDPGAPGLAVTSDGKPKIIDVVDATGSGDVSMEKTVKISEDGTITGVTGRKLSIPSGWLKPDSGDYHIGVKELGALIPGSAKGRYKSEVSAKHDAELQTISSALLETHPKSHPTASDPEAEPTLEKLLNDKNTEYIHEGLSTLCKDVVVAPQNSDWVVDCIAFKNGDKWYGAVDLSEVGDFSTAKLMNDFQVKQEWHTFGEPSHQNYSFKFYENEPLADIKSNGLVMCVVTAGGSHGTHVAGIACANFPDDPARNGVAPGAQVVAVKIGDSRLNTLETNVGLVRGIKAAADNGADLINYSYGESVRNMAQNAKVSVISEALEQFANKHGGLFVTSAGNSGPGLSSMGAPACLVPQLTMGVGAQVFPSMMGACYSMLETHPAVQYSWSSRGPTYNGALGVSISAPGGAVTSVPNYTLQKQMLMNGTSMSSPNACGCTSLIISGCKQAKVPFSIFHLKRAIENTAKVVDNVEPWAQGQGLIQVDSAFKWLQKNGQEKEREALFDVYVSQGGGARKGQGIYIREAYQTSEEQSFSCEVRVEFEKRVDAAAKIGYTCDAAMVCNEPWVSCPKHHELQNNGGGRIIPFAVKVDPTKLPEEGCFYTEIQGFDLSQPDKGPIFRIPVTVLKSHAVASSGGSSPVFKVTKNVKAMKPGQLERRYFSVPQNSTNCTMKLNNVSDQAQKIFMTTTQILPDCVFDNCDGRDLFVALEPGQKKEFNIPCVGGATMEFAISRYWSATGGVTDFDYEIDFTGCVQVPAFQSRSWLNYDVDQTFNAVHALAIKSMTRHNIAPKAELTTATFALRPQPDKTLFGALGPRDIAIDAERTPGLFQQILTYEFKANASAEVQIFSPAFHAFLYENSWYRQLILVTDSKGSLVQTVDSFGNQENRNKFFKVKKDETYTVRFQLAHKSESFLKDNAVHQLLVKQKLEKPISLKVTRDLHACFDSASVSPAAVDIRSCDPERVVPLYVIAPSEEQLKGTATLPIGAYLNGTMTVEHGKTSGSSKFPFKYYIMDKAPKVEPTPAKKAKKDEPNVEEEARDAAIDWIKKYPSLTRYEELRGKHPDHLGLYEKVLGALWEKTDKGVEVDFFEKVCDDIIAKYNIHETIAKSSVKNCSKEASGRKTLLQDAHIGKMVLALLRKDAMETVDEETTKQVDGLYRDLLFFNEDALSLSTTSKHSLAMTMSKGKPGWNLKYLLKAHSQMNAAASTPVHKYKFDDKDGKQILVATKSTLKEIENLLADYCATSGWTYLETLIRKELPAKYPEITQPF